MPPANQHLRVITLLGFLSLILNPLALHAQDKAELAKKLSNPVASLISLPIQVNYDENIGPADEGERTTTNIQPVIPISLSSDWNLISRTILPVVSQRDIFPGAGSQSGTGDIVQSLFFSPAAPTDSGWIWGAGPAFLLPTASDDLLGAEKWGAGPTGVALKQNGPWTYGILANHISSFAGDDDRGDISATFMQPFMSYTTASAISLSFNTESTYDWEAEQWAVPLNTAATKVVSLRGQLISVGGGLRYWAESPDNGAEDWGARLILTLLFPK